MGKKYHKQEERMVALDADLEAGKTRGSDPSNATRQAQLPSSMAVADGSTSESGPWASGLQPRALNGELSTAEFDAVTLPGGGSQLSVSNTTATAGAPGTADVVSHSGSMQRGLLSESQTTSLADQTLSVDESATVAVNQDVLRSALVGREVALEQKRSALEQARSTGDSSRVATLEAEVIAEDTALGALRQQIDTASSLDDIEAAAGAVGVDAAKLKAVDRVTDGVAVTSKSSSGITSAGYTSTESTTIEETRDDGKSASSRTSTDTTQVGFSGGQLSAQRGRSETQSERTGGLTEARTVDNSTKGSFGNDGLQVSHQLTTTNTIADGDDTVVVDKQSTAVGGGFDGETVSGNIGTSNTTLGGATVATQGGASVTEDSVGLQATRTGAQKDGGETVGYSFGGVFNLTFRVEPIPDTNPPRFQSVFKVKGGGSVGGSGKSEGTHKASGVSGEASIGASASASVELSHTQMLSDEDVSRYHIELSEWETTGKAPSGLPAFGIDRLRALADQVSDPGAALALLSAEAAAGLDSGESMTMNLDGSLSLSGGGGAKMGGKGVSGSASWSGSVGRDFQVSKTSGGLVRVSLSFDGAEEIAGKLGVSVDVVSASMGGKSASSEAYSATFVLDPNASSYSYSSVYARIAGCLSSTELQALAEDSTLREAGAVTASTESSADSDSMSGTVGNQLLTVGFSQASAGSSQITESNGQVSGVFTGSNTSAVDVSAGPLQLGHESRGDATLAVASDGGMSASITDTQTSTLPTLNPSWTLSSLLKAAYPDRYQIDLDNGDMQTLLARAGGDATRWQNCCPYSQFKSRNGKTTYVAWATLRSQLANPRPDPLYVSTQPEVAVRLSQASAIAEFMRWPDAQDAVYNLCNEYGASLHSDSRNIGKQSEWPSTLSDEKSQYDNAVKNMGTLSAQLSADETDMANGYLRGMQRCSSIMIDFLAVKEAIEQNMSAFDHQATALEMMARIDSQLADLTAYESDFSAHFDHGESRNDGQSDAQPELLQSDPDLTQVTVLEGKLSTYVSRQDTLFAQIRSNVTSEVEGRFSRFWTTLTGSYSGVLQAQKQLREVYEGWKFTVIDLRKAYEAAGVAGDWKVSRDRKAARTELEPDVETFRKLYQAAAEQHTNIRYGLDDFQTWVKQYEKY